LGNISKPAVAGVPSFFARIPLRGPAGIPPYIDQILAQKYLRAGAGRHWQNQVEMERAKGGKGVFAPVPFNVHGVNVKVFVKHVPPRPFREHTFTEAVIR